MSEKDDAITNGLQFYGNRLMERALVHGFLLHMHGNGWRFKQVDEGGERLERVDSAQSIAHTMDLVFGVEDATVYCQHTLGGQRYYLRFVLGNSPEEVLADHSAHSDDEFGLKFVEAVEDYNFEQKMARHAAVAVVEYLQGLLLDKLPPYRAPEKRVVATEHTAKRFNETL